MQSFPSEDARDFGESGIDVAASVEALVEHGRSLAGIRRRVLDLVVEHIRAELLDYDIERTMATMVPQPRHEFYGGPRIAPLLGYEAVRSYYLSTFELGPNRGAMSPDHIAVTEDVCVVEGTVWYTGAALVLRAPDLGAEINLNRPCALRKRLCVVMPIVDMRIAAELHYFDGPYTAADLVAFDESPAAKG